LACAVDNGGTARHSNAERGDCRDCSQFH
jgi:hypothetical protein